MIETVQVRKVKNGYVVQVTTDVDEMEYIFQTERQMIKFIREQFKE